MRKHIVILLTAIAFFTLNFGCKRQPDQDIRINVNTDIFSSPLVLRFVNANTTSSVQPDQFSVTISGKDAALIVTTEGTTNFQAFGGILALAVNTKRTIDVQNPIHFTISTQINGFMPITRDVVLTSNDPVQLIVSALELANLADGIGSASRQTAIANGIVTKTDSISTPVSSTVSEGTKLYLKSGTQLLDKNGTVITGGSNVTSNVLFFSTGSDASLKSFPGGLSPQTVIGADGNPISGGLNFMTAGLLRIQMTANGVDVKSFSQPINAAVELNPTQDNFATGQPVKAGDSIPVWSLDEATGVWKYETKAIVVSNGTKLSANFPITHLSCWNLDWGWSCFGSYNTCPNSLKVKTLTTISGGDYEITLRTPSGNYLGALHNTSISNNFIANFTSTPMIPQARVVISDNRKGTTVAQSALFNPCSTPSLDITVPGPVPPPDNVNVNITIQAKCKNKAVNANIGTWFYLTKQNEPSFWQSFYTQPSGTQATLSLENGKTYNLYTYYNGLYYSVNIPLVKANFVLPSISGLTGTASYNAATNTLTVKGVFEINC